MIFRFLFRSVFLWMVGRLIGRVFPFFRRLFRR
jgi:hypothetical protein